MTLLMIDMFTMCLPGSLMSQRRRFGLEQNWVDAKICIFSLVDTADRPCRVIKCGGWQPTKYSTEAI